jgi:hypothetical protein
MAVENIQAIKHATRAAATKRAVLIALGQALRQERP